MSCENNVCGTGGWAGPQPGDPDNNITLSVRSVFSGLLVAWSYPLVNPNAVAYTDIYRSETSDFSKAIKLTQAGGASYLDRLDPKADTEYFYWIEVVSIHGTRGARIGPAMGIARPVSKQTMESLTGLIDASLLAQELKTSISGITLNHAAIIQEIKDRLANNIALQTALAAVQGGVDEALTYVLNETTERITANSAMVNSIDAIAVGLNENTAAIVTERTVRVGKDEAMASQISTLSAKTAANTAAIITEQEVRSNQDGALARDVVTLFAETGDNSAAIKTERIARTNANSAFATEISNLSTNVGNSLAAVNQTTSALASDIEAVASTITTVESSLNGNIATVQSNMTTKVNALTGEISAMWTAKVQVNDLIGGFGLSNDGRIVDAGFDVDRFWVGRSGPDRVKPFIVSGSTVYIDKARIRSGDIDTLKIAGDSIISGAYAEGGAASISAGGSRTLISRSIDLGDGFNSGLIVSASVGASANGDATIGFRVRIDGEVCGDQRASVMGGYGFIFPVNGFGYAGSRYATVTLEAYSPTSGAGANQAFSVGASCMSIMGGKR